MGLLTLGKPLPWNEAATHADHVRKHGIVQLLNIWNRLKSRRKDHLLWGDEIEYIVVKEEPRREGQDFSRLTLSLDADECLEQLQKLETSTLESTGVPLDSSWKPEYARYMLEGTPGLPYGASVAALASVEQNMIDRRILAQSYLKPGERIVTMTVYPHLGVVDDNHSFVSTSENPDVINGVSRSLYIPDIAINPHLRFPNLTKNIRLRRGSKVAINLPIYRDVNTATPFKEPIPPSLKSLTKDELDDIVCWSKSDASDSSLPNISPESLKLPNGPKLSDVIPDAKDDHVYMDAMCFGMGCCCLQVTFQACSIEEARRLYDHLAVLTPIMLALSAGSPAYKGYLVDVDCRWDVISASVDDRTKEERCEQPLDKSRFVIPKSRYGSINSYLSPGPNYSGGCTSPHKPGLGGEISHPAITGNTPINTSMPVRAADFYKERYNDLNAPYDQDIFKTLINEGVDELLAKHYAHLFIRDPLVIFEEFLHQDDAASSDHFENIQSTNWQTMRFKPPPPGSPIGWRVEFRSMEIQLTDFENAAFAVFIVLLTRTILSFDLNFYIPLSKVDENMKKAQMKDAVLEQKFWFRKNILGLSNDNDEMEMMTVDEIMNGKGTSFRGLIPMVSSYLQSANLEISVYNQLTGYLQFLSQRSKGTLPTTAKWIRAFLTKHQDYKKDSVVTEKMNYDLMEKIDSLNKVDGGRNIIGLTTI